MDPLGLALLLVISGIAGWIASQLMGRRGLGFAGSVIVGFLGFLVGGLFLPSLGIFLGFAGSLISAVLGACLLLYLAKVYNIKQVPMLPAPSDDHDDDEEDGEDLCTTIESLADSEGSVAPSDDHETKDVYTSIESPADLEERVVEEGPVSLLTNE